MDAKALSFGVIGFLLGGLVVSIAATQFDGQQMMGSDDMTMGQMNMNLKGKTGDAYDTAFLSGMIMHHEGAIEMAKLAEENAKHDEIKQLASDIMTAQSKEIDMMQTWQTEWGYKDTPTSHDMMSR